MPEAKDIAMWKLPAEPAKAIIGNFKPAGDNHLQKKGFIVAPFKPDGAWYHLTGEVIDIPNQFSFHLSDEVPCECSHADYIKICNRYISACEDGIIKKAIFSRVKGVDTDLNPLQIFNRLCQEYPFSYIYLFSSAATGTWVGVTPEILLTARGNSCSTMSLAGTRKWDSDEPWHEKEFEEQAIVTNYIYGELKIAGAQEMEIHRVRDYPAGPVRHLLTEFEFYLYKKDRAYLLRNLHPTPAVSGFPVLDALDFIAENEVHDRGYYAGFSGITGTDLTLWVNLRCMQITRHGAFIYTGGGITEDSNPESEWIETENKAQTLSSLF